MRLLSTLLMILLTSGLLCAQEPAHNIIGEEELDGLVVFSLLQDERANIWVSTSAGLFRYNGYEFKEFTSPKISSKGLFGLTEDRNREVYCYNTSGQIFKVTDDELELYYTVPDSLFSNFFYLAFDDHNNLLISGTGVYILDGKKSVKTVLEGKHFHENPIIRKPDGSLQFYSTNGNDLYTYRDSKLIKQNVDLGFKDIPFYYPIFTDKNEYLGVGRSSHLLKRKGNKFELLDLGIDQPTGCWIFVDDHEDIWVLNNQRGLYLISDSPELKKYSNRLLFPTYTISTKLEDRDGNIWLGTFGKGIIQVSNKNNQVIKNSSLPNYDELKCIAKDKLNNLYIGSVNGRLYQYSNDELYVRDSIPGRIDVLKFDRFANEFYFKHLVFDNKRGIYNQTPFGSIRNISFTSDSLSIVAAYTGIYIRDFSSDPGKHTSTFKALGFSETPAFGLTLNTGRLQCATYDSKSKTLWVGESTKLKVRSQKGESEFKLNGHSIIALDMLWVKDELYIATLNKGVLVVKNNKVHKILNTENGLLSNTISGIKLDKDRLVFGSNAGLQSMNIASGEFTNFKNANGRQLKVRDFEVINNVAYVIHSRGIQTIHLVQEKNTVAPPILDFIEVLVNDQNTTDENNLKLNYDERNLNFSFAAKTYNNQEQLVYKYRIQGLDETWKTLPYDRNFITLQGLDHGNYQLQLYAIDANGNSSNQLLYSFSINQPFWMAWWFYLIIVVFAFTAVILFYRRLLRVQQKKSEQINELNKSKLTAIQSQMNPHFIFNSLNSIQDLVIRGDVENSYSFITKFANLVRKTLNYSSKDFIEFEQEVQLLELYLTLEKLRFKDDFDFHIETNEVSDIMIPPMLIQPFIENALVHGLLHKEGHKQLEISFQLQELLTCEIKDNGVGRDRAREIKARQNNKHESFAVKAIKTRLEILKEKFGADIGFEYFDLSENGTPTGTMVRIQIPVQRRF